jgi:hypothetical protein
MRAKISSPYDRLALYCAVQTKPFPCVENDRALVTAATDAALAEAHAILAQSEPAQEAGMSGHWPCGRPNRRWDGAAYRYDEGGYLSGTGAFAHAALAESLAQFIAA